MPILPSNSTTLILNGYVFNDYAAGSYIDLNPVNPLSERINGANDSFTVTQRVDSNVFDLIIRLVRYSGDDVILTGFMNQARLAVFNGSLKQDYLNADGLGDAFENWTLEGGTFTTQPSHNKDNLTNNHIIEYTWQFRNAKRLL